MIPIPLRDDACLWLSKSGTLEAHTSELRAIASTLSQSEVVAFYVFLRDSSQRWESEWRSEFTAVFSISDDALPRVDDAERWPLILHTLISHGDARGVRSFLEGIGALNWDFTPVESEPDFEIYPLDTADDIGELPIEKARRLGFLDIAEYIAVVRGSIAARYRNRWRTAYEKNG